ncbi:MAG: Sensory transduction protein regX3 [Burkholderia lata]|uniref:Sensory transduction protein regX3 n=1 Tax=Burkholderia lata (strain ATCC 17760 / DSM 23089 / LMG 22485 / NCIMB 9086 / R18194 / 383) TaxID=482957 RepID=A0A833PQ58_BURL3|nr:response regulator transcription factor [Burkholderia lata]KAF1036134.1 MAG: Sensory transduction protein regX3 [Burkholderia lata]
MRILSLDDEPAQAALIDEILSGEGHQVHVVNDGNQAIRLLETHLVDLVLLDWHVPGISGLDVLGWIRERIGRELPVLFLTNRAREDELVAALNAGADDYMIKPIRRRELIARVNALLRRAYPDTVTPLLIRVGAYHLDVVAQTIHLNGESIKLTPKEFSITALLFRNLGRIMPRDALVKVIWGRDSVNESRSLDTHIYRLRTKLRIAPENGVRLRAIYTHGYRLEPCSTDTTDYDE